MTEALELGQAASHTDASAVYAIQLYYLRFLQGQLDTLAPLVRHATDVIPDQPLARCAVAEAYVAEGNLRKLVSGTSGSSSETSPLPTCFRETRRG